MYIHMAYICIDVIHHKGFQAYTLPHPTKGPVKITALFKRGLRLGV